MDLSRKLFALVSAAALCVAVLFTSSAPALGYSYDSAEEPLPIEGLRLLGEVKSQDENGQLTIRHYRGGDSMVYTSTVAFSKSFEDGPFQPPDAPLTSLGTVESEDEFGRLKVELFEDASQRIYCKTTNFFLLGSAVCVTEEDRDASRSLGTITIDRKRSVSVARDMGSGQVYLSFTTDMDH